MEKDWHISLFSIIYILSFPLIYISMYTDFKGYILFLLIWMIINIPSLLTVLVLLAFEYLKDKKVPKLLFHLLTVLLTSIVFLLFLNSKGDPKNIFPILQENKFLLLSLGVASHVIAFIVVESVKKFKPINNAS